MSVGTYALTSVDEIRAWLGSDVRRDAFWIYYSGSASTATVQVDDDTLKLVHDGGTDASLDLTADAYDTLAELVDYINTNVTSWEAGRIYHSDAESDWLLETGQINALGSTNEVTLKIVDVYLIERLIDRATDYIERYCNRKLKSRDYTREIYWGSGSTKLILDEYPVTRVSRLSEARTNAFSIKNTSTDTNFCTVEITSTVLRAIVDGGANDDDTSFTLSSYTTIDDLITAIEALDKGWSCTAIADDTDSRDASEILVRPAMFVDNSNLAYIEIVNDDITDYKLLKPTEDRNEGIIYYIGEFNEDLEYFVNFTAGYTTIPNALEEACIRLVALQYNQSKADPLMKSESLGDYSYTKADFRDTIPPDLKAEIDLFKKVVI